MNLLRARSALSRSKGAASTFACASLSSIMRSRAFSSVSRRSLIPTPLLISPSTATNVSVEGRRKLALAEEDRRLVVIVAHLGIAGGGERNDGELARCQPLRRSKRASCRFADDRRVRLQVSALAGTECLHEVGCLSGHEGSC